MSKSKVTVFVVLDPSCGDNLATMLPKGVPAWVVDSPQNHAAVEKLWKERGPGSHLRGITLLTASTSSSPEEVLLEALDDIDLHHGEHSSKDGYVALEIIGAKPSGAVRAALADLGFGQIKATPQGFRTFRST